MQTTLKLSSVAKTLVAAGLVAGLAACGGGGDSTPAPKTLTVTGTAAVGAALSGANIAVTCRTGSGTAVAAANGSFSANVTATTDVAGPCVLTAVSGSTTLRSITPGAGVANITPLTDMLTNYLATRAGTSAANLLTNTQGMTLMSNPTEVQKTATLVQGTLASMGVSVPNDFLTASLVPPNGSTPGNAQDQALERMRAAGVVNANGQPSAAANTALTNSANANRVTGATGAN